MSKERKPYPSETQDRFIVRFPDGMRDRIRAEADKNGRSMNAEIIARLEQTFSQPEGSATALDSLVLLMNILERRKDGVLDDALTELKRLQTKK